MHRLKIILFLGAQRTLKTMENTLKKYKVYNNTSFQNKIKKKFFILFFYDKHFHVINVFLKDQHDSIILLGDCQCFRCQVKKFISSPILAVTRSNQWSGHKRVYNYTPQSFLQWLSRTYVNLNRTTYPIYV